MRPINVGLCEGFRMPAVTNVSTRTAAGVRKPPRDETAGRGTYWAVPRAQLWGFGGGRATAAVGGAVEDGVAAWGQGGFVICGGCVSEDRCGCCVVRAVLKRAEPWPAEGGRDGRTAFLGGSSEIAIMRCRS